MKIVNYKLRIINVAVLSIILFALALPIVVFAEDFLPLVPCFGVDCTFCHFFTLFQNIFNFAVTILAPAVAVFGVAYGGYWILIGGANPSNVTKGKDALKNTAIGFVVVYASYAIASTLVWFLATGLVGDTGIKFGFSKGTFQFACSSDSIALPEEEMKDIIKDGVMTINIKEEVPVILKDDMSSTYAGSSKLVDIRASDKDVNVIGLNSELQDPLATAAEEAVMNNIELVVTSGKRDLKKQEDLAKENCVDPTAIKCEVLPGKNDTCIPDMTLSEKGSNCNHTTGKAVDVFGMKDGVQCGRSSSCQQSVIKIMKANGFCVLTKGSHPEPWHFELESQIADNRKGSFDCP